MVGAVIHPGHVPAVPWSSSVGEPWVAGSIPASTSARVAVEPQALPVTRRAHGDVAPLPRAGSIHPGLVPARLPDVAGGCRAGGAGVCRVPNRKD